MPALLTNIKIEDDAKFALFKVTLADLRGVFSECHFKFRGAYKNECLEFSQKLFEGAAASLTFYQDLREDDWVDATLSMLSNVKQRSLFLYFEDHKLVAAPAQLNGVLCDFDSYQLDYLCYSFFNASALRTDNLLPFAPFKTPSFNIVEYSSATNVILGKISPRYCSSSLVSIFSKKYFERILSSSNSSIKWYPKALCGLLVRLLPDPGYRIVIYRINKRLMRFGACVCTYHPSSPFNVEKVWFEAVFGDTAWRFGVLTEELFANYDDDNGAYGESLIKRGLYPFEVTPDDENTLKDLKYVDVAIALQDGEQHDCTYFSHRGRIRHAPAVEVFVEAGRALVTCQSLAETLECGDKKCFYANKRPLVTSVGASVIRLRIFDECF